jgi:hypothetical protein
MFLFCSGGVKGCLPVLKHLDGIELPETPTVWIDATKSSGEILRDLNPFAPEIASGCGGQGAQVSVQPPRHRRDLPINQTAE